jgi:hypothetical protein
MPNSTIITKSFALKAKDESKFSMRSLLSARKLELLNLCGSFNFDTIQVR